MDRDLVEDSWQSKEILNKIKTRRDYAQNVYAAMCNMRWQPLDVMPILKDEYWTCSWRSAGGIVADFRKSVSVEDYMDWYCSGIQDYSGDEADPRFVVGGYVPEGVVTDEILEDFATLGWSPSPWPKDKD